MFPYLCVALRNWGKDPVAQPVEHITFNDRVLGSNPSGITLFKIKVFHKNLIFSPN